MTVVDEETDQLQQCHALLRALLRRNTSQQANAQGCMTLPQRAKTTTSFVLLANNANLWLVYDECYSCDVTHFETCVCVKAYNMLQICSLLY